MAALGQIQHVGFPAAFFRIPEIHPRAFQHLRGARPDFLVPFHGDFPARRIVKLPLENQLFHPLVRGLSIQQQAPLNGLPCSRQGDILHIDVVKSGGGTDKRPGNRGVHIRGLPSVRNRQGDRLAGQGPVESVLVQIRGQGRLCICRRCRRFGLRGGRQRLRHRNAGCKQGNQNRGSGQTGNPFDGFHTISPSSMVYAMALAAVSILPMASFRAPMFSAMLTSKEDPSP